MINSARCLSENEKITVIGSCFFSCPESSDASEQLMKQNRALVPEPTRQCSGFRSCRPVELRVAASSGPCCW